MRSCRTRSRIRCPEPAYLAPSVDSDGAVDNEVWPVELPEGCALSKSTICRIGSAWLTARVHNFLGRQKFSAYAAPRSGVGREVLLSAAFLTIHAAAHSAEASGRADEHPVAGGVEAQCGQVAGAELEARGPGERGGHSQE